jgi:voltage-gated potassium channel Kch
LLSRYLSVFEKRGKKVDEHKHHSDEGHEIFLFGYNRLGYDILESLKRIKSRFIVIDFDPEVITSLYENGIECKYGDANDSELLDSLDFSKARLVVSTVPIIDTNLLIISKVREQNKDTMIAVVSHQIDEAVGLYEAGATYVIMPHFLGGKHFSTMIEQTKLDPGSFVQERVAHIEHLKHRKRLGHKHPMHEKL